MNRSPEIKELPNRMACLYALGAIVSFSLAYAFSACAFLMVAFLACVYRLAGLPTSRRAYYFGLVIGLAIYTPHLLFFWKTFSYGSIALWYVLPFWLGLFLVIGRGCLYQFGPLAWACLAPFVWTGLEYFRSELYYLRFSWLNPGFAFSGTEALHYLSAYGVYGIGFLLMTLVSVIYALPHISIPRKMTALSALGIIACIPALLSNRERTDPKILRVAGVQLEAPSPVSTRLALDRVINKFPDADVLVMCEYSFFGPIPDMVKTWCRKHQKFLVVGGVSPGAGTEFYNTAFVVGTNGEIVFQQAKCVPVQFMNDGLPARQQELWNSPWGKIGLGICYDASYSHVTDELIRQGAQALIFPTLDEYEWGAAEHLLHGRIAPMRAAEYSVPVFRVCGSGISQFVDSTGIVQSSAPFPGEDAMLAAELPIPDRGRMPPDRWLARISVALTAVLSAFFAVKAIWRGRSPVATEPKSP